MSGQALDPAIIVIFGITGDLAQRKLLPALYHLYKDGLLHEKTEIVGVTRQGITAKALLKQTEVCVLEADKVCDAAALKLMQKRLSMFQMDLRNPKDYNKLRAELDTVEQKAGTCMNRLYYLSIPPGVYRPIVQHLGEQGLNAMCQHGKAGTRLLIEKPFGYDWASARNLIDETGQYFKESQIFRIDHYLAKETVQNILTFRLHNPVFENLWDHRHVSRIDITANEKIGIEGRAVFYEPIGAMRDLIQSHLLQLLAITTMEKPENMSSAAIHKAKLALLSAIEPVPTRKLAERATRGQYEGYRKEVGNTHSITETYARVQLFIKNRRWKNVPIHISTGKALAEKKTTISLTFTAPKESHTNVLTFAIQPEEGIGVDLCVKRPGFDDQIEDTTMDFRYQRTFNSQGHPDAYERVLVDAVRGDHTLFATSEEVMASWRVIQPVIDAWRTNGEGLITYKRGAETVGK